MVLAIELGDGLELVLIEEALDQDAVDLLADAPVLAVDEIIDTAAIGELDASEVTEHIVVVGGGEGTLGLGGQLPVRGVGVAPMVEEPVLGVVVPDLDAVDVGAVAVRIVGVGRDDHAVLLDLGQPSGEIIGVGVGSREAAEGLGLLGDAPERIAGVTRFVERRRDGGVLGFELAQKVHHGGGLGPVLRQRRMMLAEGPDDPGLERCECAVHFRDGGREALGRLDQIAGVDLESASNDVLDRGHARVDLGHQGLETCHRHDGLGALRRELSEAVVA
ncbi:MAG: hypothetical protein ACT4QB_01775 [Gammaproteobacteria bacterium]